MCASCAISARSRATASRMSVSPAGLAAPVRSRVDATAAERLATSNAARACDGLARHAAHPRRRIVAAGACYDRATVGDRRLVGRVLFVPQPRAALRDDAHQLVQGERLSEDWVAEATGPGVRARGRHDDDRNARQLRRSLELGQQSGPVHHGHHQIDEHESWRRRSPQAIEGGAPVRRDVQRRTPPLRAPCGRSRGCRCRR